KAEKKQVSIHVTTVPAIMIAGDLQRLNQVFVNVLDNACDAAPVNGNIWLVVGLSSGKAEVTIEDDGPGISSEDHTKLFEPFYTTKDPGKGMGLGLVLSRSVMENIGGLIDVSNGPHGGAMFTLT